MLGLLRVALAILVLPVSVTLVIPACIARAREAPITLPDSAAGWVLLLGGLPLLLAGGALFIACVARFWRQGRGTLAPWDPPDRLVTGGPYAHVRNPMISGVVMILFAEAMLLRSPPQLAWAAAFSLVSAVAIPLIEEPWLRARFGEAYDEYARNVPRLVPRFKPFRRSG